MSDYHHEAHCNASRRSKIGSEACSCWAGREIKRLRSERDGYKSGFDLKSAEVAKLREQLETERESLISAVNQMLAAEVEARKLREQLVTAKEALAPFAAFAANNVDEHGWKSNIHRESISTWFGPSEFRVTALTDEKRAPPGGMSMEDAAAENFGLTEDDL